MTMGYRQTNLERLIRSDEAARFRTRGLLEEFQCNDPKFFPNDEVSSQGCYDTHSEAGEKEILKEATWFKIMLRSVIPPQAITKRIRW
jgi:hypothetical protein